LIPLLDFKKKNELFLLIADQHAITEGKKMGSIDLRLNTIETVKSWLAAGIDPERTAMYIQSEIPEISQLSQILSCFISKSEVDRTPAFKEKDSSISAGFWFYPVLQASDIAAVGAHYVPVGHDQLPHLEKTRLIIANFNKAYKRVLVYPEAIIQSPVVLPGTDARKMSSSLDNYLSPSMDENTLLERIRKVTTLKTQSPYQKIDPKNCTVYQLYAITPSLQQEGYDRCRDDNRCMDCKSTLAKAISEEYSKFRYKMEKIYDDQTIELLKSGTKRARSIAQTTIERVKDEVGMSYFS